MGIFEPPVPFSPQTQGTEAGAFVVDVAPLCGGYRELPSLIYLKHLF